MGIAHRDETGEAPTLYHAVGDRIDGEYAFLDSIESGLADAGRVSMYSPFVVWKDAETAVMYYCHISRDPATGDEAHTMRVLESTDVGLERWTPSRIGAIDEGNVVFAEPTARDVAMLWDPELGQFLMYYVVTPDGSLEPGRSDERANVVRLRLSADLTAWSEPVDVLSTPPGYHAAESIFVLKKDGLYYLWVCGFDYGLMSLYISEDPADFGDPSENRIAEQSGHGPEIALVDGTYWMACVAIASTPGNPPASGIDLPGVSIQPLIWEPAGPEVEKKVTRHV
jgi:hypothetical protein